MDFHRLARRELQTLCKKNKIPANVTNVAMADALKALEIVEGIEEFLQPCESETAQSSIESPVRSEVTSPYVPPTGGRSTCRRKVVKEEPETAKPMTRSRRTTRRTLAKDSDASQVDAIETPAAVVRTNRKKALMASACRKMDSQLKECVEEEKKDILVTPAPLGVTSRRRAVKGESAVKRVYSTRRSVRLVEKNAGLLKEVEDENPGPLKKDLFTKDRENVTDDLDGISGITGGDENTNVEEKKDEVEVVSGKEQDISLVNEGEMVSTGEDKIGNHYEADRSKPEVKEGSDVEIQEVGFGSETEAEYKEQNSDKTEAPKDGNIVMPLEVQDSDGPHDVLTSEIKITVESKEELDTDKDADEYEVKAAEKKEGIEVISSQKQDVSIISEGEMVITGEEETGNHFEADGSKPEVKEDSDVEIRDVGFGLAIEAEFDEQKCDKKEDPKIENIIMPISNELQESNGTHDVKTSEIEITVKRKEEMNTDKDAECEGKAAECTENIVLESEVEEASCDTDIPNEIEKELYNDKGMDSEDVTDDNVNEEVPEIREAMPNTPVLMDAALSETEADVSEKEFNTEGSADFVTSEAKKESTDAIYQTTDDSLAQMPSDISLPSEEDETKMMKLNVTNWNAVAEKNKQQDPVAEKNETNLVKDTEEPHGCGFVQHEESAKSADEVISDSKEESTDDAIYQNTSDISLVNEEDEAKMKLNITNWNAFIADLSDTRDPVAEKNEINLVKDTEKPQEFGIVQHEESTESPDQVPLYTSDCLQTHGVHEQDSRLVVKPTSLTLIKSSASNVSVTKKRMTAAVSDNKENEISSGSKLFLAKERVKTAKTTAENVQNLDHLSVRKLTKMLKEKLTITNKESKNENENENENENKNEQAFVRPALQALPENRQVNET